VARHRLRSEIVPGETGEGKESRMHDWITELSLLTTALIPAPAMAQERPWEWGMHPGWWMWGAGGMVMMLIMLVFWGLVIAGLVLGIRWLVRQGENRPDRALDILRERYARGEINKEEFEARKRDLGGRAA
jgi:putative membrane protein